MAVTIQTFLRSFPEFQSSDPTRVSEYIDQINIEACYDAFDPTVADLAVKLHVAHILATFTQSSSDFSIGGQKVKKLKTKHDEIQFMGGDTDVYGFDKTQYGRRLESLLERHTIGFDMGNCW